MNEQLKKALTAIKQHWSDASKTTKRMMIAGAIGAMAVALVLSIFLNTKDYVVIYEELAQTEAVEILGKLQEMGVSAKVDNNDSILVLKEDEAQVRMALATEGYPKSGLSYYLIEKGSGMLTTDYEKKQYANMQLQERIAASIKTLDGVRDAVVTITMPDEKVFYLEDREKASASAVIHMQQGYTLSDGQIAGIQNLVARSVLGLEKENIALIDSQGNDLAGDSLSNSPDYLKVNLTREIENDIRKKIFAVLNGPYDEGDFKISVTAKINTDALIREETLYTPSAEGTNTGVISESSVSNESYTSGQGDGGIAGTDSNAEIPTYPAETGYGDTMSTSSNEQTKYQVSQIKSQTQRSGADVESISIGIAINKDSFAAGERESVIQLVAFSAGVSAENIAVENFVFKTPEEVAEPPVADPGIWEQKWIYIAAGVGFLLLVGITVMLILKRKKKRRIPVEPVAVSTDGTGAALDQLFGPLGPVGQITPVKDSRGEAIKVFARENPDIVAQMIKSWLRSEND